jgi:hypothetical protein
MHRTLTLAFFLVSLAATLCPATVIHVCLTGNDINDGSNTKPVATPKRAQEIARLMIRQGLKEPLEIRLKGGLYRIKEPLVFGPEDSGTKDFPVTWQPHNDQKVVWSGGVPISLSMQDAESAIWSTRLDGIGLEKGKWNFRQLFAGGKRMIRARFPNASEANPFLYATGGGMDHIMIEPSLAKASWNAAPDAQINLVPNWRFFNQWNTVTKVSTETGRIDFADSERHTKVIKDNWFWIEGVREELDEPGEWHLDVKSGLLEFIPPVGLDLALEQVTAPILNRFIYLKGDVNAGTHVENVHFEGIEFRHTTFTLGHIEARVHTDAAVMFENTKYCSVRNCHFENIGGYALWLHLDCQHNVFSGNTVRDSGGGGVLMTGSRFSYMDDSKIYTPGEAAAKVAPILNEVCRNTVEQCGRIRYYGGGVHLDSRPFSMSMSPGNLIAHNHFNDLSRNGVFAFRNQGGNVVEYNHIHNAMQTTIDGAAIHFATMNHLNAPNYILNNWLYDVWGFDQKPSGQPLRVLANGVFLDWDTSNTTVKDNWIYNTVGKAIKPIWKNQNLVIQGNQVSDERIVPPFVEDVGPNGKASHGIDIKSTGLTGRVIHYSERDFFKSKGEWQAEEAKGMVGLFVFNYLAGSAEKPAEAIYTLPIPEDGTYKISLLYKAADDRASNVPVNIRHALGEERLFWNMREGSKLGFAVELGQYAFKAGLPASVSILTAGTDGKVIVDSLAFVKVAE